MTTTRFVVGPGLSRYLVLVADRAKGQQLTSNSNTARLSLYQIALRKVLDFG